MARRLSAAGFDWNGTPLRTFVGGVAVAPVGAIPSPSQEYDRDNEAQFRRVVGDAINRSATNPTDKVIIGIAPLSAHGVSTEDRILGLSVKFETSDTSNFNLVGHFLARQKVATTNSIQALEGYAVTTNPSGTVALSIGTIGNVEHDGAGTVTWAVSLGGGGYFNAGAVTNWASHKTGATGGSVVPTNAYGLYVGSLVGTNKWALWADTEGIRFGASLTHAGNKIGFFNTTPAVQQSNPGVDGGGGSYVANVQSSAYTGAADGEAKLADLNALRVAYENLRLGFQALQTSTKQVEDRLVLYGLFV